MKKYSYHISVVFDDGASSRDEKANTKKEAYKILSNMKEKIDHMSDFDKKHTTSIELYIDRSTDENFINFENIYYKKVK